MHKDCVLNMGISVTEKLDLNSQAIADFATAIMQSTPIDRIDKTHDKPRIELFQQGTERHPREVQLTPDGVQLAAGADLTTEERLAFVRTAANAAEVLHIPKLALRVVDVRFIFRATHWGNHHRLVASVFWSKGPLAQFVDALGREPYSVDWTFVTHPSEDSNLVLAMTVHPRTSESEIRSGKFDGDDVSIMCGLARTGGFQKLGSFTEMVNELIRLWEEQIEQKVVDILFAPLAAAAKRAKA